MRGRTNLLLILLLLGSLAGCGSPTESLVEQLEVVLLGGRVMDPETGLDEIRNIGIASGRIVSVTREPIQAPETINVGGLVVAPGFIDLHAHGQDDVSNRLQARDGVTTALEMEVGVFPVGDWLDSRQGRTLIHYGATAGHIPARVKLMSDVDVGHKPTVSKEVSEWLKENSDFAFKEASPEQIEKLTELLAQGLDEGALGLGIGVSYTPAATRTEIFRVFQLAASKDVPVFIHVRGPEPGGRLVGFEEAIANAATTGASLHIVHANSSANESARVALEMIRGARERGLDVTSESYPYTAGSTWIESPLFDDWEGLPEEEYHRLQWPLTGERLTARTFKKYRKQGGWVILHGRSEKTSEWLVSQRDVMVASDGIPFLRGPAHPRGAGTFARILGHYVRKRRVLTLMDALRKMTIMPAQRLETVAPEFKRKGRVQATADADLTVFDPDTVIDRATYEKGDVPSDGIIHVLVRGTFVVRDSELVEGVYPGKAIRGSIGAAAQEHKNK